MRKTGRGNRGLVVGVLQEERQERASGKPVRAVQEHARMSDLRKGAESTTCYDSNHFCFCSVFFIIPFLYRWILSGSVRS